MVSGTISDTMVIEVAPFSGTMVHAAVYTGSFKAYRGQIMIMCWLRLLLGRAIEYRTVGMFGMLPIPVLHIHNTAAPLCLNFTITILLYLVYVVRWCGFALLRLSRGIASSVQDHRGNTLL